MPLLEKTTILKHLADYADRIILITFTATAAHARVRSTAKATSRGDIFESVVGLCRSFPRFCEVRSSTAATCTRFYLPWLQTYYYLTITPHPTNASHLSNFPHAKHVIVCTLADMIQAMSLAAVEALVNADSPQQQIESLKLLKNNLVGHDQRKEIAVRNGVLGSLVTIVSSSGSGEQNGTSTGQAQVWTQQDEARLQATIILGSLATGGAAYVHPLIAAGSVECLLATLQRAHSPKLVTATLQALRKLAASWKLSTETGDVLESPSLKIFDDESTEAFLRILKQSPSNGAVAQQLPLVCEIIASAAHDEGVKSFLTESGVLDALAGLLVSFSVKNNDIDYRSDSSHLLPSPHSSAVPNIMSAISSLIAGSTYRAHKFVLSEHVKDLFLNFSPGEGDLRYMMGPKYGMPNADGALLPPLYMPNNKSVSFGTASNSFPVLSGINRQNGAGEPRLPHGDVDHANAVCSWLIYFARTFQGSKRVYALKLLAMVNEAVGVDTGAFPAHEFGQQSRERERQLSLLAVPLAVRLIDCGELREPESAEELAHIREQSCQALALLISCSRALQSAAVDAGAIKQVCPVLKKSFDNVPLAKPMWSSQREAPNEAERTATRKLGDKGLPMEILHAMRCRQGALDALAAIGHREDSYRKAIVEAGVMSCIVDSLRPFPQDLQACVVSNKGQLSAKDGNTTNVVLAACRAAKSMSRSTSLLRTSLIDAGIAKPIFELLTHQNVEVQVAATNVCANLLLDFSPMREDLVALGVMQTLCIHAKCSSPPLRLASMWALKHLMLKAPRDLKTNTLNEIGADWLINTMAGEHRDVSVFSNSGGVSVGLSSSNAAGEQVDLLNPSSMDLDEPASHSHDDDIEEIDDDDGEIMYDEPSNTHYQASQMRSTLPPTSAFNTRKHLYTVRELEENPDLQARRDDIAIQEQALDFLRNLFNGEDCADMVDYFFREHGHQRIFDLLTAKLAPLPASRRQQSTSTPVGGSSNTGRPMYHPTELLIAATAVITHIANGAPHHKQLLVSQRALLEAWLPHFSHADRRVRINCVWAINSLTWIEDERDRSPARDRYHALTQSGIAHAVRSLANDEDRDVRERVRTAQRQMESL